MYLLIYVDDMIIVCREKTEMQRVEAELKKRFRITSLGPVHLFLGIAVEKDTNGVYSINQSSFIRKIAKQYGLDGLLQVCREVGGPAEQHRVPQPGRIAALRVD